MLNNNLLNNARTPSLNSVNTNITSQEVIQTIKTSINSTKNIRRYSNKVENRWWDKSSKAMPAPSTQRMMYLEKYYSTSVEARQMLNFINTMQKLNHKQKKFYSSGNGRGNKAGTPINSSFNNEELLLWLPPLCISSGMDFSENKSNPEFVKTLANILRDLDKTFLYKLDYSLFLHTNDKDKEVVFLLPPVSGIGDDNWSEENMFKYALFQKISYENCKYHGYHVFKSDYIDLNDYDFSNYSSDVFSKLGDCSISEGLLADGFIEFKKSTVLKITRLKRGDENAEKITGYTSSNIYSKYKKLFKFNSSYISSNYICNNDIFNSSGFRCYSTNVNELSKEYNYRNNVEKELLNSRMAISILSILNKNNNDRDKQLELERFIFDESERELINNLKELSGLGKNEGLSILLNAIKNSSAAVESLKSTKILLNGKKYGYFFINTSSDIIISIIISNIIPHILKNDKVENQSVTLLYERIGILLIKEYEKIEYSKYKDWYESQTNNLEPQTYKLKINRKNYEIEAGLTFQDFKTKLPTNLFETEDFVKYALDLVELLSEHSKLFTVKEFYNFKEKVSKRVLLLDSEAKDKLLEVLSYDNNTFPMISTPNDWDVYLKEDGDFKINKYGGYIKNIESRESFIHKSYKNVGFIKLSNKSIINTINYLQKVEYIINKDVINTITDCLQDGSLESYLYLNYHPMTEQLSNLKAEKDYYKIGQILKYNSICYNNRSILTNALILKDIQNIYFPVFIDWRGRIYSKTTAFSYQGSDLSKSLFLFKKGEIINKEGVNKLKLYAANSYGMVKRSSNKRMLAWVDDNLNDIINIDDKFWMKGKEPLQSLAASIELRKYYESSNKDEFLTHLPIYIDATCNGLQHLASMSSDINLAKYVNLLKSTDSDYPNDLYGKMVDRVKIDISELIRKNPDNAILSKLNINRDFVKRGIMTIPYGVTKRGVRDQLLDEHFVLQPEKDVKGRKLYKADDSFIDHSLKDVVKFRLYDITNLANLVYNVLFNTYPNLTYVVNYLKDMNSFLKELGSNMAIIWKTPSGLILEQRYVDFDKNDIKTNILGKSKTITLRIPIKDKVNLRKQNQGIIPNLIHSLDASNISILVNKMIEDNYYINLLTIHDCFATNANHVEDLTYRIKLAFLIIYGNKDYLINFHEYILEFLINKGFTLSKEKDYVILPSGEEKKIPNPPTPGELDINKELALSSYFVH